MKLQHLIHIRLLALSLLFLGLVPGCVSVQLPTPAIRKSTRVIFSSPEKPFEEIKSPSADKAWLSGQTGNTISFLSECENPADPSLKQIESDSMASLGKMTIENTQHADYNGREALITEASGTLDGVPIKVKLVIVKKNSCNYTLTYGGVAKNYLTESAIFENFVQAFKIP